MYHDLEELDWEAMEVARMHYGMLMDEAEKLVNDELDKYKKSMPGQYNLEQHEFKDVAFLYIMENINKKLEWCRANSPEALKLSSNEEVLEMMSDTYDKFCKQS